MENSTTFFSQIEAHLESCDIKISIKKRGEEVSVSYFPTPKVNDPIKNKIPDIILTGKVDEINQHFFQEISRPMELISKWTLDTNEWEDKFNEMQQASKQAEEEKKAITQKQNRIKTLLDESKKLLESKEPEKAKENSQKAIKKLNQVLQEDPENAEAKKLLATSNSPSLF